MIYCLVSDDVARGYHEAVTRSTSCNPNKSQFGRRMVGMSSQPAHLTKHISLLSYPFASSIFALSQLDNGHSNGTALWLGGQCLSMYLAQMHSKFKPLNRSRPPRAIELGSGIGLTAYVRLTSKSFLVLMSFFKALSKLARLGRTCYRYSTCNIICSREEHQKQPFRSSHWFWNYPNQRT